MHFTSDYSISRKGFLMFYKFLDSTYVGTTPTPSLWTEAPIPWHTNCKCCRISQNGASWAGVSCEKDREKHRHVSEDKKWTVLLEKRFMMSPTLTIYYVDVY